ncbi:MAG: TetR/AcrR family transcriptional regulator [Aquihabitans sp.]
MSDTVDRILDVSQGLLQTKGYAAFSYTDVAEALSITKPAVHFHFRSKADLGLAVTRRYRADFARAVEGIERAEADPADRLAAYAAIFAETAGNGRACLFGLLASDVQSVPEELVSEVGGFLADQTAWLARIIAQAGIPSRTAKLRACSLFVGLEGALLFALVPSTSALKFDVVAKNLVNSALESPP